jgi:hypothetical protein
MRSLHLVGSFPDVDEITAMDWLMCAAGTRLRSLSDGEIGQKSPRHRQGERLNWVQHIFERLIDRKLFAFRKHPIVSAETGFWSEYSDAAMATCICDRTTLQRELALGYIDDFRRTYKSFRTLREKHGLPELRYQVGIPGPLNIPFLGLRAREAWRLLGIFRDRLADECQQIWNASQHDLVFQLELVVETCGYIKSPWPLNRLFFGWARRHLRQFVERLPPAAPIGLHFCYGDLANRSLVKPNTCQHVVTAINQVLRSWPSSHQLAYVHLPLAMGHQPAPLQDRYYQPLSHLELPPHIPLAAGFVHEARAWDELLRTRAQIERQLGRDCTISMACGLGRRPLAVARNLVETAVRLCKN